MPELTWIGKEAVVGHHAQVPFRLLEEAPELSCPPAEGETENLIVQGDNLEALKALLPRYAGQVKCIYIDPPYNTGNEGWVYNDAVNRRFILVELDEKIARDITAERVRRVARGYTSAKGETVAGLGGGFQFARLGKPLFDEAGAIRSDVTFTELAEFVFFKEIGRPLPRTVGRVLSRGVPAVPKHSAPGQGTGPTSPLLGVHEGRAVYLLFNGILGDRSVDGGNVLTGPVLAQSPAHAGPKVIYAAACRLGRARLEAERITFKQTPYDLQV